MTTTLNAGTQSSVQVDDTPSAVPNPNSGVVLYSQSGVLNFSNSSGNSQVGGFTTTGQIILNADPTQALGAVTKQYADAISAGMTFKTACLCATTANLNATYSNGTAGVGATLTNAGTQAAFSVDGQTPAVASRVLVKNQSTSFQNGIYVVTVAGTPSTNWVLTRASDYDTPSEVTAGSIVPIQNGTVNAVTSWLETAVVTTIGTDPITFTQFSYGSNVVTSVSGTSNRITSSGGQTPAIDISAAYVGQTSITTLGTVATGTWASTPISLTAGGTNANLTPSNGGIFYSTSTSGAILAGTATAGQFLLSGATAAPTWSNTVPNVSTFSNTTNATSGSSGALIVSGGVGIAKDLWVTGTGFGPTWTVTDTVGTPSTPANGVEFYSNSGVLHFQNSTGFAQIGGFTTTGAVVLNADPILPLGAVTKQYADAIGLGTLTTNGIVTRTSAGNYSGRTITAGSANIAITNGNGVSGNPVIDLSLTPSGLTSLGVGSLSLATTTITGTGALSLTSTGDITITADSGTPGATLSLQTSLWTASKKLQLLTNSGIEFFNTANTGSTIISAASAQPATTITYTLPTAAPTVNSQVLSATTAGVMSWSSATYPVTTTINQILYSSAANVISGLATANNGTLITSGAGVPSISSTLPSAVQLNITSVGTVTAGTWSSTPIALSAGGTNANLTASNGGIFYSTASAGAILSGTATAGQFLLSGATAAPTWSNTVPNISTFSNTTNATSISTGALKVSGGLGVAKDLWIGGNAANAGWAMGAVLNGAANIAGIQNSILSTSVPTNYALSQDFVGSTTVNSATGATSIFSIGGTAQLTINGTTATFSSTAPVTIQNTTNTTSATTGALVVSGGIGIGKDLWIGGSALQAGWVMGAVVNGTAGLAGIQNSQLATNVSTNYALQQDSSGGTLINAVSSSRVGICIGGTQQINVNSTATTLSNTSNATSTTTGAFQVAGGVGIGKDLWLSNNVGGSGMVLGAVVNGLTGLTGLQNSSLSTASTTNYALYHSNAGTVAINAATTGQQIQFNIAGTPQVQILNTQTNFLNGTDSADSTSGAIVVTGGMGVQKTITAAKGVRQPNYMFRTDSSNQAFTGITTLLFGTNVSSSGVTYSGGTFTVPIAGLYMCECGVGFNASGTSNVNIWISVNGSAFSAGRGNSSFSGTAVYGSTSCIVSLAAGGTIAFGIYAPSANTTTGTTPISYAQVVQMGIL